MVNVVGTKPLLTAEQARQLRADHAAWKREGRGSLTRRVMEKYGIGQNSIYRYLRGDFKRRELRE